MKKGFKIFAVLGLVGMLSYACQPAATDSNSSTSSSDSSSDVPVDMKVAYVYTDSVINQYEYFKKRSDEITEKGRKFEGDLQSRARGFEQEVANFQQSGGNMTLNQQRAKQEELMKKEQNLVTYRDNLMQELSVDESNLYNEVFEQVQSYLKTYAEEKDLDLILSYTRGGAIWYGKKAFDLTNEVIEGLNKEYNQSPKDSVK
ncbi:periplasmic chaperone for outer membrane proteins Skp [Algoriphagus faecimaris]|uniref:Periplasmic chaperone for outer membrane proteins Skp n=1 Tax=Algoriphagus faecimaris TaxID=686796 RepID=A0A1G6T3E8_9BACT|nr:OmpH family outer membrane protein [Algoriphagus faecimaris]SDD23541.1 periplasmic chaperone for outer membrane proteins Skp [Algoriphagus faecimaris]